MSGPEKETWDEFIVRVKRQVAAKKKAKKVQVKPAHTDRPNLKRRRYPEPRGDMDNPLFRDEKDKS